MKSIIFATGNTSKIDQLTFIKAYYGYSVDIIPGKHEFGDLVSYAENFSRIEEIALNGAKEVAYRIQKPVLTEDSDFWVEGLDGLPGTQAKQFLGTYGRSEILNRLTNNISRKAMLGSAVAYALPDGTADVISHRVEGTIAYQEQWDDTYPSWISPQPDDAFGGGFNAIFIPDGESRTLAQISPEEAIPWSYREYTFSTMLDKLSDKT